MESAPRTAGWWFRAPIWVGGLGDCMSFDRARHARTLQRYRFMFKTSVGFGSVGAVLSLLGLLAWAIGPMPAFLPWSLALLWFGGTTAYKVVLSTTKLLDKSGYYERASTEGA